MILHAHYMQYYMIHYMAITSDYMLRLAGHCLPGPALPAVPPFVPRPVPQRPAVPAVVYEDPLQRILLTSKAIRQGHQALQRHMSALEDLDLDMPVMDHDGGDLRPVQALSSRYRQNLLKAAQEFPRTVAEFFCAWSGADISAAKGNTFLGMARNPKFSPHDLAEFTCVQTMESRIMKFLFPEGHKTKDLTRRRDGKKLILHYVPYIEIARRQLRNEMFAGKMYHNFQVQWSTRRLGVRAIGRANSGTLFQAAQIRATHLAQGSGLGKDGVETRVAGLLTVSDATYGEKNMPWHGSYGKITTHVVTW